MTRAAEPAYLTIKNDLLDRIRQGELRPGDKIDHEETIAEQYGCARATVHRAIRELAEEGYVERKRRAGTRVASAGARSTRVTIPLVRQQVEARGATYRFTMLEQRVEVPTGAARAALGLDADAKALFLSSLHFANDQPFQLEERWINLDAVPEAQTASFETINPNEWLLQTSPYTEAAHFFSATNATKEQAQHLGIQTGDALFLIERQTQLNSKSITFARLLHPGSNYRMAAETFSFSTKN